MKKIYQMVAAVLFCCSIGAGTGMAAPQDTGSAGEVIDTAGTGSTVSESGITDSLPVSFPLCTLSISTTPEGAAVLLDGTLFGTTPLVISNIDTGSHVLLLKKSGYYQKKVAFTLPASGSSDLSFSLTAPGRLEITTEPSGAAVVINGTGRGVTPHTDSLLKPATYQVVLTKDGFLPSEKTVEVKGGAVTLVSDTLQPTATSPAGASAEKPRKKGKHFTVGLVAAVFSLFLAVLAIVELAE